MYRTFLIPNLDRFTLNHKGPLLPPENESILTVDGRPISGEHLSCNGAAAIGFISKVNCLE